MITDLSPLDRPRPPSDHRNSDSTFIKITLPAAEQAAGVKAIATVATFLHCPVVARENHESILGKTQVLQLLQKKSDVVIHIRNHGGEGRLRFALVGIMRMLIPGGQKLLLENRAVFRLPLFLGAEASVWNLQSEMKKERAILLLFNIIKSLFGHHRR